MQENSCAQFYQGFTPPPSNLYVLLCPKHEAENSKNNVYQNWNNHETWAANDQVLRCIHLNLILDTSVESSYILTPCIKALLYMMDLRCWYLQLSQWAK